MPQTHYEVLGVAADATPDEIRKRFRELARRHHPDVNPDKAASHQAFVRITEAYRVLNDPTRRAGYDLTLRDRARRLAERNRASANGGGSSRSGPAPRGPGVGPNPPPPPNVGQRSRFGSPPPGAGAYGRAAGGRSGSGTPRTQAAGAAGHARPQAPRPPEAAQYVRAAQAAYASFRYRDAIRLCKTALQIDSRSALACGLLGDIYRAQGRVDDAIHYYTLAVQLSPPSQNRAMMSKLEDLLAREPTFRGSPAARAAPRGAGATVSDTRTATAEAPALALRRRASRRVAIGAFGFALALLVVFALAESPAEPLTNMALISAWTAPMIWAMILGGAIIGATLAFTAAIRPLDEELFFSSLTPGRIVGPPVGLVLFLTGALFFYLSVGVYLLVGALQESFSRSVMRVFAATFLLICGLAVLVAPEAGRQILLLGGNVVFISMLLGWMLGDFFRPLGSV